MQASRDTSIKIFIKKVTKKIMPKSKVVFNSYLQASTHINKVHFLSCQVFPEERIGSIN